MSDSQFRVSNQQLRVSESQFRVSNRQLRVSDSQFRVSNQQFRVSESQFRVSDQRSVLSDGRLRVSDTRMSRTVTLTALTAKGLDGQERLERRDGKGRVRQVVQVGQSGCWVLAELTRPLRTDRRQRENASPIAPN